MNLISKHQAVLPNTFFRHLSLVFVVMFMSACGVATGIIQDTKRNLSVYEAPITGDRARIRLAGGNSNPIVYPGTACNRGLYPGAGRATKKGPFGPAPQRLGIPQAEMIPKGVATTEIYARAGEPITMEFSVGGSESCPVTAPGHYCVPAKLCRQSRAFVPEAGKDYEALFTGGNTACHVEIVEIKVVADSYQRTIVPSQEALDCPGQ